MIGRGTLDVLLCFVNSSTLKVRCAANTMGGGNEQATKTRPGDNDWQVRNARSKESYARRNVLNLESEIFKLHQALAKKPKRTRDWWKIDVVYSWGNRDVEQHTGLIVCFENVRRQLELACRAHPESILYEIEKKRAALARIQSLARK